MLKSTAKKSKNMPLSQKKIIYLFDYNAYYALRPENDYNYKH